VDSKVCVLNPLPLFSYVANQLIFLYSDPADFFRLGIK